MVGKTLFQCVCLRAWEHVSACVDLEILFRLNILMVCFFPSSQKVLFLNNFMVGDFHVFQICRRKLAMGMVYSKCSVS